MLKAVSDTVAYILRNKTKGTSSDLSVFYIKAMDVCQLAQNGETDKIESAKKMMFLHIDDIVAEPAINRSMSYGTDAAVGIGWHHRV